MRKGTAHVSTDTIFQNIFDPYLGDALLAEPADTEDGLKENVFASLIENIEASIAVQREKPLL